MNNAPMKEAIPEEYVSEKQLCHKVLCLYSIYGSKTKNSNKLKDAAFSAVH